MKYTIEILSPVHIGSGNTLFPYEYVISRDYIAVMNLKNIFEGNLKRLNQFINILPDKEFDLAQFLTNEEKNEPEKIKYKVLMSSFIRNMLSQRAKQEEAGRGEIQTFIKSVDESRVYIPGSTIKGAIRTGLAYGILRTNPELLRNLADDLNRKLRTPGMKLNDMDEYVNYSIFGATAHKPQNDLMRVIAASDSDTVKSEQALELSRMRLFSLTGGGQSGDFKLHPRYLETVRPGVTFAGDFAINTQLLDMAARLSRWRKDQTKYFSYKELLQRLNIFARDIINWELSYFKKLRNPGIYQIKEFYSKLRDLLSELKENEALLCIGYGISWHKMTVGLLMEQRKNFNFVHFRSTLRLAKEYLRFEFPKSRRLVLSDENKAKYPYGWMRLTLL